MEYLPMLLETADKPFSDGSYIFEAKMDGLRLIATRINGIVQLWTRHGLDLTNRYPDLLDIPVEGGVVLDCELIVLNDHAQDDFELCMRRFHTSNKQKQLQKPAFAIVFDVLYYQGEDVRNRTLMERKQLLGTILKNHSRYIKIPYVDREGEALFKAIQQTQQEGMVAKRKSSINIGRRSDAFLKIIDWKYEQFIITGWRKEGRSDSDGY